MTTGMHDPQRQAWQEYARRKQAERVAEAAQVWQALSAAGVVADTVLALDFVHFGAQPEAVDALRGQLAENYPCAIEDGPDGYRLLKGTTRPYGVTLAAEEHLQWVLFMCDCAQQHGCVFSSWSIAAPALGVTVRSDAFEASG